MFQVTVVSFHSACLDLSWCALSISLILFSVSFALIVVLNIENVFVFIRIQIDQASFIYADAIECEKFLLMAEHGTIK